MKNNVGQNVRRLRLKKGWVQGDIAKKLNISVPAFSKIENGLTDVNIERLYELAAVLGVGVSQILFKVEDQVVVSPLVEEEGLNQKIIEREEEIKHLQKKLILLYEELFNKMKKQ